jgi:hypothetical protein
MGVQLSLQCQPIYDSSFEAILPPVQTSISRLQIADTAFYYPEDRGVSESFRFARLMVRNLADGQAGRASQVRAV